MASKLAFGTIRVYLHGIATTHVELGFSSPLENGQLVWRMFDAIKRVQGAAAGKQKMPITTELLSQLEQGQKKDSVSGLGLRAAMWLGTCGLLRSGEFAVRGRASPVLQRGELKFMSADNKELTQAAAWSTAAYMTVRLAQSKTDPFREGVLVVVSNERAVIAMAEYLSARGYCRADAPLFEASGGAPLDVTTLVKHTRCLLTGAGVEDASKYAGHSFRRGGASSLHHAGLPDSLIRVMGRWKSFTFARYVDVAPQAVIDAGRAMTTGAKAGESGKRVTFSGVEKRH